MRTLCITATALACLGFWAMLFYCFPLAIISTFIIAMVAYAIAGAIDGAM